MTFPKQKAPHSVKVLHSWLAEYGKEHDFAPGRLVRGVSFMVVALALSNARDAAGEPLFLVKGGASMELRLSLRARTTKDLDAVFRGAFEDWLAALDDALAEGVADFALTRSEPEEIETTESYRLLVYLDYRGRRWATVKVEVAPAEIPEFLDIDKVPPFDIGQFGLPGPDEIAVAGLPYLIAQKLHACTEVFGDDENKRVHDVPDLLMARGLLEPGDLKRVREACVAIFWHRGKHAWPPELIVYPSWPAAYARIVETEGLPIADIESAVEELRSFIAEIDAAA